MRKPGSYAANCLLARRLLERGVRFVQLFHRGWDQHIAIARQLPNQCRDIDQPTAALSRTSSSAACSTTRWSSSPPSSAARSTARASSAIPAWAATITAAASPVARRRRRSSGGIDYGATDDFCYNIVENPVHLRDLHATILHCLGIDHDRFTYKFRGLNVRLTGVEEAHVVKGILA